MVSPFLYIRTTSLRPPLVRSSRSCLPRGLQSPKQRSQYSSFLVRNSRSISPQCSVHRRTQPCRCFLHAAAAIHAPLQRGSLYAASSLRRQRRGPQRVHIFDVRTVNHLITQFSPISWCLRHTRPCPFDSRSPSKPCAAPSSRGYSMIVEGVTSNTSSLPCRIFHFQYLHSHLPLINDTDIG